MPKRKSKNHTNSTTEEPERLDRTHLPQELEDRLQVVWRRIGHYVDWCDDFPSWIKMFCSEARPYRATFYWESVAEMVSDFMLENPETAPDDVLTDCLVATQSSPSSDDRERLSEFCKMWADILDGSRAEIETFIQADLELAAQEGTYENVARLYSIDYEKSKEPQPE